MKVEIRHSRSCLWVNPGMTDVTTMKKIHFKMDHRELYVPAGFHSDCASVPMWWVAAFIVLCVLLVAAAAPLYVTPYSVSAIIAGLLLMLLVVLWLRKSNLLPAGIIHDAMYAGRCYQKADKDAKHSVHVRRSDADRWFRTALVAYTMPATWRPFRRVAAFLAWGAVRLFGWRHYKS